MSISKISPRYVGIFVWKIQEETTGSPAYAGERQPGMMEMDCIQEDPHACGGKIHSFAVPSSPLGQSPRTWGKEQRPVIF